MEFVIALALVVILWFVFKNILLVLLFALAAFLIAAAINRSRNDRL